MQYISYSIPYLVFALILFVLMLIENLDISRNRYRPWVRHCTFLVLLVFFGLRGFVLTDWISYYELFKELPTFDNFALSDLGSFYMEPGFILYSILIKSIYPDYHFWVFINTLIDLIVFHVLFRRYTKHYCMAFFFFFVFMFMVEVNLYRNMKSIDLFLLSLIYIPQKKFYKYLLLNVLGTFFHVSSVLYILLYPVLKIKRISNYFLWGGFLIGNVFYMFSIRWAGPLFQLIANVFGESRLAVPLRYIETEQQQAILSIGYIERCFTFIIMTLCQKKIVKGDANRQGIFNCYVLYYFMLSFFAEVKVLSDRFAILFLPAYCFIYCWLYESLRKNRKVFILLLFCYSMARQVTGCNNELMKYTNLLWGIDSYENRVSAFATFANEK